MIRKLARTTRARYLAASAAAVCWSLLGAAHAQTDTAASIVDQVSDGGHVLVLYHGSASAQAGGGRGFGGGGGGRGGRGGPGGNDAEPRLDDNGQAHMTAIGYAFRQLDVEIDQVLSSPASAAVNSAEWLGYEDEIEVVEALADGGQNANWLRRRATEAPAEGANNLIVTHAANIEAAFGEAAANIRPGETLVVRPQGGRAEVVGRLTVRDWAALAVSRPDIYGDGT